MAISFDINGEHFKTQKSAIERVQQLLENYDFDSRIEAEDFAFFFGLIKLHAKAAEKIGNGIKELWVRKCRINEKNKTLKIIRNDLSDTQVSWRKCLAPPKYLTQVKAAARNVIDPQVIKFREKIFCGRETVKCAETGVEIDRENCHIDHLHPKTFDKLFEDWSVQEKIDPEDIKIDDVGGHGWKTFMDEALRDNWCKFHEQKAELRPILRPANLALGNRSGWDKGKYLGEMQEDEDELS
tara:strand:- start:1091 stop:1810 length:720 start_codon:yes stop_codon:yes gene_type:complete